MMISTLQDLRRTAAMVLIALVAMSAVATAQQKESGGPRPQGGLLAMLPDSASSRHSIQIDGKSLPYKVTASTLPLRDGQGQVTALIFSVAYQREPADRNRPITFVFNGGPGAAATYLHLGGLGPRVLATGPSGDMPAPPARLVDNPDSWLAFTDLVFVDPVGTGYSRAADSSKEGDFLGVDQDTSAMGAFLRLYLQQEGRRASPVYLVGESYGGFRVALLSRRLLGDSGIRANGLVLISPALEFSLLSQDDFALLPTVLSLPSMAAVRLEEQGVSGRAALATRLKPVEDYAMIDYLTALASGLEAGGKVTSPTVAAMTGLPETLVARHFGRVPTGVFLKDFARAKGEVRSRYDGSIGAPDPSPQSSRGGGPDPVLDRVGAALTSTFVDYVREEVGYRTDVTYRVLNNEVNRRWDFGTSASRQGYAGAMEELQEARSLMPSMRVLIANGYTDLATPYLSARFLVSQLPALAAAAPIDVEVYEGGHMMYLRPDSRHALTQDALALFAATSPPVEGREAAPVTAAPTLP